MIVRTELKKIARHRLKDAEALLAANRCDGAFYICGYAVELALKARNCRTLKWPEFPSTRADFEGLQSFRTHDLDVLLTLTGREASVKQQFVAEWSAVRQWNPEARYQAIGSISQHDAQEMISATQALLKAL